MTKNYFHVAEIDSFTQGLWYTCLVSKVFSGKYQATLFKKLPYITQKVKEWVSVFHIDLFVQDTLLWDDIDCLVLLIIYISVVHSPPSPPPFLKEGVGNFGLWNKRTGAGNKILEGGLIQKDLSLLKRGAGKVKVNFSWPKSRLKMLALWAFSSIQEIQNSKLSPTMVESCPNHNIPFSLF